MSETRPVHPSVSKTPIALDADDLATVCVLCSHNCGIRVDVKGGRIEEIRADERNPITQGYICNKAVTCDRYAHHDQRIEYPMRRRPDGSFERIDWDTAISEISERLGTITKTHGGKSLALVGIGGQANHMDAGYASSFLRAAGSRRLFNAYAQEKTQHHLIAHWMFDASPTVFFHPDFENTQYLLVLGTNPRISNRGHKATELFKGLGKKDSCKVVVADPRETETTRGADQHLRVKPGTDAFLLAGLAAAMVQNELYNAEFVGTHTVGFAEVRDVLARIEVADMASRCGLKEDKLLRIATEFAGSKASAIMFDLGVEQTPFSTLISYLIHLNSCLVGSVGQTGGNLFVETFLPPSLSGSRHEEPERAVVSDIPAIRALGDFAMFSPTLVPEEIMADHPDRIRAVIVEGSNPLLSYSDTGAWREAIDELDLLVVIEPAFTETARLADYVLPTPCGYEKWEIAMFPKRFPEIDVQLRPPVIPGPSEALPEPEIYVRLAEAMGLSEPLPDELAEIGQSESAEARAAFMGAAMAKCAEAEARGINGQSQLIFWAYRAIGHHFAAPSLVAIWAQCLINAIERTESVVRGLGPEWKDSDPMTLAEEMWRRIMLHPEGVMVALASTDDNLRDHIGHEDGLIRMSPQAMVAELERAIDDRSQETSEYPFVMASGLRTRWTANTIQRDPAWRRGSGPHCEVNLCPEDAESLGVRKGDLVRIETKRSSISLPAAIDKKLKAGHVWMPNGFGIQYASSIDGPATTEGANMNEITDVADRDPFTGIPHHRCVRVKLTKCEGVPGSV